MEKQDQELIDQLMDRDPELKQYVEKHRDHEKELENLIAVLTLPPRRPSSAKGCKN